MVNAINVLWNFIPTTINIGTLPSYSPANPENGHGAEEKVFISIKGK